MSAVDGFSWHVLIDSIPDAVFVTDGDGRILFVNPASEAMFGYGQGELVGQPIEVVVPHERRQAHVVARQCFAQAPAPSPTGVGRLLVGLKKNGIELPVDVRLGAMPSPTGPAYLAVVRDASERVAADRKLREAEERFRLAFDQSPIGLALVELNGRFSSVNEALCTILGYSSAELMRLSFQAVTHPSDLDENLRLADRLLKGPESHAQRNKRYLRKDGAIVEAVLTVTLVKDPKGAPLYYISQVEDVTEQRLAEESQRRSAARYRNLVEGAPEGVFVADPEGRYIDVNAAACRLLGYTREELVGMRITDLVPPEEIPRLRASRQLLLTPGVVQVAEWNLRTQSGEFVPVEVSAVMLADGRRQAFVHDISERKRASEALRRSEEGLARAQRAAHLGSFDWDLRTRIVIRSAELCAICGIDPIQDTAAPGTFADAIHPADRAEVLGLLRAAESQGHSYELEHRLLLADGTERFVLHRGEVIREEGRPARIVGTMLDITARKRAEHLRGESLQELQAVLDECPVGIILARGAKGESLRLNLCAKRIIGQPVDYVGQYPAMLQTPEGRVIEPQEHPILRALHGEAVAPTEFLLLQAGRPRLPVSMSGAPIPPASDGAPRAVVTMEDLTALKALERLRAEWSSIVAHDLRQPLNAVALHAHLVMRKLSLAPAGSLEGVAQSMEAIARSTARVSRMIDDLLDLSRLEAHRLNLSRSPTDLVGLVRNVIEPLALEEPVQPFEVRVDGAIPTLNVDPDRIGQIVENLLSNARKYGKPGAPIVVGLGTAGRQVRVRVTNEGPGIASEALPRLFGRFVRAEDAKHSRVKGIGLGLYITRELVAAHGGDISVESIPGIKTTFQVTLPIEPAA